jgi:hypothetical protein
MKIIRNFVPSDRYHYDLRECTSANGWAQLDTRQDASYYGNWANPITRELVSYCEGDVTHTQCDDDAEFATVLRECIEWHKTRNYFIGIDGMCRPPIIEAFLRLGFDGDLH